MTATVTSGSGTADAWRPFAGDGWRERIDVRDFIQANYTPYEGDSSFLAGPTGRTRAVWGKVGALFPEERRRGVLDVDGAAPSTITSWPTDAGTAGRRPGGPASPRSPTMMCTTWSPARAAPPAPGYASEGTQE